MLAEGRKKHEIKKALYKRSEEMRGKSIGARQCEDLIGEARQTMIADSQQSREDHLADSYSWYLSVIQDPHAKVRDKILARTRIDRIMGIDQLRIHVKNIDEIDKEIEAELAKLNGKPKRTRLQETNGRVTRNRNVRQKSSVNGNGKH